MTTDHILLYSIVTVGVSFLLVPWVGWIYAAAGALLGVWLIGGAVHLRVNPDMAMRYFTATNVYLAGVFLAVAIDVLVLG